MPVLGPDHAGLSAAPGVIAETVEGTRLQMLVHNHVNRIYQAVAIKAPGFGEKRIHLLEDMAALCGGQVHSRSSAFALEQMTVEHLGRARQVRVTSEGTTIIGGRGDVQRSSCGSSSCAPSSPARRSGRTRTSSPGGSPAVGQGRRDPRRRPDQRRGQGDPAPGRRLAPGHARGDRRGVVAGGGAALLHAEPALDRST
jgi:chaperonin GroEL